MSDVENSPPVVGSKRRKKPKRFKNLILDSDSDEGETDSNRSPDSESVTSSNSRNRSPLRSKSCPWRKNGERPANDSVSHLPRSIGSESRFAADDDANEETDTGSRLSARLMKSHRLRNKKEFSLPSRKSVFDAISKEKVSPSKLRSLRPTKLRFELIKGHTAYNQRDGNYTEGSDELDMKGFIDDEDVGRRKKKKKKKKSKKMAKLCKESSERRSGRRRYLQKRKCKVHRAVRKSGETSSDSVSEGPDSDRNRKGKRKRRCAIKSKVKRSNYDVDKMRSTETSSDCDVAEGNNEDYKTWAKALNRVHRSISSGPKSECDEEDIKKKGKRRKHVFDSDASNITEEDREDVEDDIDVYVEKDDADSTVTMVSSASDSESGVFIAASRSARNRQRKVRKKNNKLLEKLHDVSRARQESKKFRQLCPEDSGSSIPLPTVSFSAKEDDLSLAEDPPDVTSSLEIVDDVAVAPDGDHDVVVVAKIVSRRCPVTRKPFIDAVLNPDCGHRVEKNAMRDLVYADLVKGRFQTRCPVAGCIAFFDSTLLNGN